MFYLRTGTKYNLITAAANKQSFLLNLSCSHTGKIFEPFALADLLSRLLKTNDVGSLKKIDNDYVRKYVAQTPPQNVAFTISTVY